jgi:hypothetical protein
MFPRKKALALRRLGYYACVRLGVCHKSSVLGHFESFLLRLGFETIAQNRVRSFPAHFDDELGYNQRIRDGELEAWISGIRIGAGFRARWAGRYLSWKRNSDHIVQATNF